jgi:hypothetical protein
MPFEYQPLRLSTDLQVGALRPLAVEQPASPPRSHLVPGAVQERVAVIDQMQLVVNAIAALTARMAHLEMLVEARTWRGRWTRVVGWLRKKVYG